MTKVKLYFAVEQDFMAINIGFSKFGIELPKVGVGFLATARDDLILFGSIPRKMAEEVLNRR